MHSSLNRQHGGPAMTTRKEPIAAGLTSAMILALALAGCEREGPAERAGKQVDHATQQAGDNLE